MRDAQKNLNISGSGSYPGGIFDNVSISGSGVINGDVQCGDLSISGSGKIKGNIECIKFTTSGSSSVKGNLLCKEMRTSGSGKVEGNVKVIGILNMSGSGSMGGDLEAEEARISGVVKVLGNIRCDKLRISGSCKAEKNIDAEEVIVDGILKNTGLISAERVVVDTRGWGIECTFNEIGATHVAINNRGELDGIIGRVIELFTGRNGRVTGNSIEGDTIYVENAKVKKIGGRDVEIGPNCDIEEVEYSNNLIIHPTSLVLNTIKA